MKLQKEKGLHKHYPPLQRKTKSSQPAIDRNKVIIEDWVDSDDEETDVSESQKETVFNTENSEESFENRSPKSQNSVGQESRTKGLGNKGGNPEEDLKDMRSYDSGICSWKYDRENRTSCLILKSFKGGIVAFGNDSKAPRKNDVYSFGSKEHIPSGEITCLVAKATEDEAVLWHRRLGHVNFKNINKLVKGNLVRGLPSKTFKLDLSCVACRKGKQNRHLCKKIE
ncbi:putative ribonuclease H-like domain-containing protein [Tanacetum coccineum]